MRIRALQLNAIVGVLSSLAASATIWLVLTRPVEVVDAVARRDYGAVAAAVGQQLAAWLHIVLRFL